MIVWFLAGVKLVVAGARRRRTPPRTHCLLDTSARDIGFPITDNATRARWRFRQVLELAGIPGVDGIGQHVVIHSTRYTFGTELARAGVSLTRAQHLLGHSDPKLTAAIYTHLGVEDLRGAVERLEPSKLRLIRLGSKRA